MRFHFVSSSPVPVKHEKYAEEVDCTFRDQSSPDVQAPQVTVTWSRTKNGDWENPVTIVDGTPEQVVAKTRILKSLMSFAEERKLTLADPDVLLVALEKTPGAIKNDHAVLVGRAFVPIRRIDPSDMMWKVAVDGKTLLQVKAKDEESAKSEAGYRLMSLVEEDDSLLEAMTKWIRAKKPVVKVDNKDKPEFAPLSVYCKRGHQRAAEEHKAAKTKLTISK